MPVKKQTTMLNHLIQPPQICVRILSPSLNFIFDEKSALQTEWAVLPTLR
jgi:hypothetical protein